MEELLALSVHRWQAERILAGESTQAIRSWCPRYRGPLAIHATSPARIRGHRAGEIVGLADLYDCIPGSTPRHWILRFDQPVALPEPVPCPGYLRLWPVPSHLAIPILARAAVEMRALLDPSMA